MLVSNLFFSWSHLEVNIKPIAVMMWNPIVDTISIIKDMQMHSRFAFLILSLQEEHTNNKQAKNFHA